MASSLRAEDAKVPYHNIYQMEKVQVEMGRVYTNLVVDLRMTPTLPNTKPGDLKVFIDSKSGKIPVAISAEGDFTVPMRDDLLAEDPLIIVNQPRGTMKLDWWVALTVGRPTNPTRYATLMEPLKDCEIVQGRMRETLPSAGRLKLTGLKLTFPSWAGIPAAVIRSKSGDRKFDANEAHEVVIPLEQALLDENPEVTFAAPPDKQELCGDEGGQ